MPKITSRAELAEVITRVMETARQSDAATLPSSAGEEILREIERHGLRIVEWPPSESIIRGAMQAALDAATIR